MGAPDGIVCELKVPMHKVNATPNTLHGPVAWDIEVIGLEQYACNLEKHHKYWIAVSPEQDFETWGQVAIATHQRVLDHEARIFFPFFPPPVQWLPLSAVIKDGFPRDVSIDVFANKAACPPDSCPADINEDAIVGINDLLDLLGNWGPCPP